MSHQLTYQEIELLKRIAADDERAFAEFMWQYTDALYAYILKIVKTDHWSEELVQDVWIQVWQARKEFAVLEHPIAYLYRIAQNRSIDWIRRNKRELKAQYLIQQYFSGAAQNTFWEKSDFDNTRRLLMSGVEALPPQRRRVFELKQSGLSYEEIAATLGISKNTVKNQMVSALQTLRTLLAGQVEGLLLFIFYFLLP